MDFLKVTGLVSVLALGLSACSDNLKTKEDLKHYSYADFSTTVCEAIKDANSEQLALIADKKFVASMKKLSRQKEFSEFVDIIDCSEVTLSEHTKNRKVFTIATFAGKAKFQIAIIKKDGFYSVIS